MECGLIILFFFNLFLIDIGLLGNILRCFLEVINVGGVIVGVLWIVEGVDNGVIVVLGFGDGVGIIGVGKLCIDLGVGDGDKFGIGDDVVGVRIGIVGINMGLIFVDFWSWGCCCLCLRIKLILF